MKKTFFTVLLISFLFSGTVFAVVTPPKEPTIPLNPEEPIASPNQTPAQPAPAPKPTPIQVDPGTPTDVIGPTDGNGSSSTGRTPLDGNVNKPSDLKVYPESNYDIFNHNTPNSSPWVLLCCLCILVIVVLGLVVFILIHHKRKQQKGKLPGLNK